jgi:hypothetical protein
VCGVPRSKRRPCCHVLIMNKQHGGGLKGVLLFLVDLDMCPLLIEPSMIAVTIFTFRVEIGLHSLWKLQGRCWTSLKQNGNAYQFGNTWRNIVQSPNSFKWNMRNDDDDMANKFLSVSNLLFFSAYYSVFSLKKVIFYSQAKGE